MVHKILQPGGKSMWSYVQYRRLGMEVENEVKKQSTPFRRNSATTFPQLEAGRRSSLQHLDGIDQNCCRRVVLFGDDDPLDPRNWPLADRCKNIAILSFLIFVQGWAGAAESMANTAASKEFGVGKIAENLSTAMYLFGIGSGSLFAGPVSQTVGRNPTYLVSTFCYLWFVLGGALTKSFAGQLVCRYFVGLCSSATLSINGATVRDQFRPVKRAFVFPVIAWANVAGESRLRIMCILSVTDDISPCHCSNRGWMDSRQSKTRLAMDRVGNTDYLRCSVPHSTAVPS